MAFVLQQSATFNWPLTVLIPVDGRRERFAFTAKFNRLKQSRIRELVELSKADDTSLTDLELLSEIMAGWDDVVDDAGKPVPFTKVALEQMAELPTVAAQIAQSYFESLKEAKRKN